ncbi:leucine-rich repeat transmembrane neuronal protein 2-like [Megalops cyprinoides]|uniref:leucine-rich repeat transmembrane neuronal protein 2-like n=1 Tax=Megalops cyprinoides TaxID=118141 RepID=UPI001864A6A1|nr:leucine-rich repeat transmembrane neuronal protein 2-like [Megalops cyprinoides]
MKEKGSVVLFEEMMAEGSTGFSGCLSSAQPFIILQGHFVEFNLGLLHSLPPHSPPDLLLTVTPLSLTVPRGALSVPAQPLTGPPCAVIDKLAKRQLIGVSRPHHQKVMALFFGFLLYLGAESPQALGLHPCGEVCDCIIEIRFLNCSNRGFTAVEGNLPPDTEHFDLSWNYLTGLHQGDFRLLWNLRVLFLNDNNISVVTGGAFSSMESLQRLDLSHNRISALSKGFSLGLGSLRELLLAHNKLTSLDGESFLHLDGLLRLDLSSNAIHSIQVRAFARMSALRQLHLRNNQLSYLDDAVFSTLWSLEVLNLRGNRISSTEVGVFTPLKSLAMLDLSHNRLSTIQFKTFLSIRTYSTHILLAHNPWNCDCDLQRVFRKLRSVHRLFLDDYLNLSCGEPPELRGYWLSQVDTELCIAETVTVLIITVTVVITVLAAIVMAERNKRNPTDSKQGTEENNALEGDSED